MVFGEVVVTTRFFPVDENIVQQECHTIEPQLDRGPPKKQKFSKNPYIWLSRPPRGQEDRWELGTHKRLPLVRQWGLTVRFLSASLSLLGAF